MEFLERISLYGNTMVLYLALLYTLPEITLKGKASQRVEIGHCGMGMAPLQVPASISLCGNLMGREYIFIVLLPLGPPLMMVLLFLVLSLVTLFRSSH